MLVAEFVHFLIHRAFRAASDNLAAFRDPEPFALWLHLVMSRDPFTVCAGGFKHDSSVIGGFVAGEGFGLIVTGAEY